ncbi:MAG: 23S rRNA (adenine(2503)-C(2))-methyltransferase RlmN [Candidatus Aminicenantes bacterium]|nr:23S rRNA (adenine(2503)-C(2))-methyltransferase RlmN [Candidatus Aminicenantes bacterium]
MPECKKDILNYDRESLEILFSDIGEPAYRAGQLMDWVYRKKVDDFSQMTNFPKSLMDRLKKNFQIGSLQHIKTVSTRDGTAKYLWRLWDGHTIETVLIPGKRRRTVCLSSQAGCRFRCPFCASGAKGLIRQLDPAEMVGQVFFVQRLYEEKVTHVVFMGIGEPLDNWNNLVRALQILNSPEGMTIGARRITISTCGLVPGIKKLQHFGLQVELSVSLHAVNDRLRDRLVPVNRTYKLSRLLAACKEYREVTGRVITFEYALIEGINDDDEDARRLAEIARSMKAKINLIPCSPVGRAKFRGTPERKLLHFRDIICDYGALVTVRNSKGSGIQAACGQLALDRMEDKNGEAKTALRTGFVKGRQEGWE